ncbi:hypothetical protein [Paenibacillus tyrfis]|uniref:Uncharacterized protein n=1 Tax=Paenibacillus tyrfis TaxID=1501230 RepID=A0A081NWP7_9BACL|nr:hypothetical protein [Paenibacillus tyrfis]KEQ22870.1 hypothetical protein ET33_21230 [Paenibacillus tyrfis]
MSKKHYHVTNDFVDRESGDTIITGSIFEADTDREQALRAADVIGKEATEEEIAASKNAEE